VDRETSCQHIHNTDRNAPVNFSVARWWVLAWALSGGRFFRAQQAHAADLPYDASSRATFAWSSSFGAQGLSVATGKRLMRDVRPGLRNCGRRGRKLSRDHFAVEEVAPLPFYPWYFDKRKTCRHWFLSKQVMVSPAILALDKQLVDSRPVFLVVQAGSHSARATRYNRPQGQFFARALCLLMDCSFLFCPSRTSGAALSFGGAQDESAAPELLTGLVVKSGVLAIKPVALLPIQCHNFGYRKARSNMASSRPPIRCELQSYFRVVIVFRGARVMRRTLGGGLCPR